MAEEYVPFEEALKSLRMSEAELSRLVSQDQIQAVRDAHGRVTVRKSDLDSLQNRSDDVIEELVFADDEDIGDDTGMVTAVLEEDSLLEEEETLDLAPEELEVEETPRRRSRQVAAAAAAAPVVRSKGRASAIRTADENNEESTLDKVLLIATAFILMFSLFFAYSITQGESTAMTAWLADMFEVK